MNKFINKFSTVSSLGGKEVAGGSNCLYFYLHLFELSILISNISTSIHMNEYIYSR